MAEEYGRRSERQRLGLEALPPEDGGGTLAELLKWWLDTYSRGTPSHERNVYTVRRHLTGSELGSVRLASLSSGQIEAFLQTKSQDLSPQSLNHLRPLHPHGFQLCAARWPLPGAKPGCRGQSSSGAKARARLPSHGRGRTIAGGAGATVEGSFCDGDIHGPSQGRVAWAAEDRCRSCRTTANRCALLRPRYDQGGARSSCSNRLGTCAVPGSSHCGVTVATGFPRRRRKHDATRRGTGECPAAGDGQGRDSYRLAAHLPAADLWTPRKCTRCGAEKLSARRTQAMAQAGGPAPALSRLSPFDCQLADDGGSEPGSRPTHPWPQQPCNHHRHLRSSRAELSPGRSRSPGVRSETNAGDRETDGCLPSGRKSCGVCPPVVPKLSRRRKETRSR